MEDVKLEVSYFAPAFAPYEPGVATLALSRIGELYQHVASPPLRRLAEVSFSFSDVNEKLEALGEWSELWPHLDELNERLVAARAPIELGRTTRACGGRGRRAIAL